MKIVHIINSFPTGGTETMLVDIVNEQSKHAKITLLVLNDYVAMNLISKISNRVSIYLLNRKLGSINPIPFLRLNYILVKIQPNIIHCHDYTVAMILSPFIRAKKVLTIHDINICTRNHHKYDQLFAISEAVKNDIKKLSDLESIVIYNGIKVNDILYNIVNNLTTFKIIQVSRLNHEKKGQHILLNTLSILINKYKFTNFHVDFIGDGPSLNYLLEIVIKLELTNYVSFLGLHDRNYIYCHLRDYNLLVQPSLFEGFGLTIVEALSAEIEVLVSDIDGPREIIEKIGHGHMFTKGSPEDCAAQIYEISSNYYCAEYQSKRMLQRQACNKLFAIEITSNSYLNNYLQLLKF